MALETNSPGQREAADRADGLGPHPSSSGSASSTELASSAPSSLFIRRTLVWGIGLAIAVAALYFMQDQLRDLLSSGPRLRTIRPAWFVVMFVLEIASFACLWWLTRIVLPQVSWFVAATSQLVSNAVSRVVPGAAATGGAIYYRMLASAGVEPSKAGGALAVTSVMTTAALVAIPAVAGLMAFLGAPIPESLLPAAMAGGVMFVVLLGVGALAIAFTRPLQLAEGGLRAFLGILGRPLQKRWTVGEGKFEAERDRLVDVVGSRWPAVVVSSAGKWAFDYLTLIAALYSVGAHPRLSLVLIAYAGAQVLGMIPLTPGGLGFVEVGLYSLLIISGISAQDASLATIAYRVISWWVPIVTGLGAWLLYLRRTPLGEVESGLVSAPDV